MLIYRQGSNPHDDEPDGAKRIPQRRRQTLWSLSILAASATLSSSNIVSDNLPAWLFILIEQNDTRLSITAEAIRNSVRKVGQHILRLYRQFATTKRLKRISGENGEIERLFSGSDITSDDLFSTENELNDTPANRKNMAIELLKPALTDENGI